MSRTGEKGAGTEEQARPFQDLLDAPLAASRTQRYKPVGSREGHQACGKIPQA